MTLCDVICFSDNKQKKLIFWKVFPIFYYFFDDRKRVNTPAIITLNSIQFLNHHSLLPLGKNKPDLLRLGKMVICFFHLSSCSSLRMTSLTGPSEDLRLSTSSTVAKSLSFVAVCTFLASTRAMLCSEIWHDTETQSYPITHSDNENLQTTPICLQVFAVSQILWHRFQTLPKT